MRKLFMLLIVYHQIDLFGQSSALKLIYKDTLIEAYSMVKNNKLLLKLESIDPNYHIGNYNVWTFLDLDTLGMDNFSDKIVLRNDYNQVSLWNFEYGGVDVSRKDSCFFIGGGKIYEGGELCFCSK